MTRSKLYRPRLLERVEVVWRDAESDSEFDGDPQAYSGDLPVLESIGYFVSIDRQKMVVASCRQPSNGSVRFMLKVPRNLVLEVRSLEKAKDEILGQG